MKCTKCGAENREGRKFCAQCGTKLGWICPQCGFENDPDELFCGGCGHQSPPLEKGKQLPYSPFEKGDLGGFQTPVPRLEDMHAQLQSLIPDALAQKYLAAEQQTAGENRLITALFADISGFTPLSATKSSEAIFQLVQDCFKRLVSIVANYEGSISGFRGDGLLALFGAPILHENDAERAILAALDMRSSMNAQQLEVSIGINTAMMTVGEIQTQLHKEYTAYGTDINLAKRLQEAAEPGQILVGAGTYRLTQRAFDFEVLPSLSLKGLPQPVIACIVQQAKPHPEKLRGILGLRARMIGREREFADLKEAADSWLGGQGQIVSIIGEAGIGKSRLVSELKTYLAQIPLNPPLQRETKGVVPLSKGGKRDHSADDLSDEVRDQYPPLEKGGRGDLTGEVHSQPRCLEGRCVSIGQPISYWPFLDILRAYFGLSEEDDSLTRARKVTEATVDLFPQSAEEVLPFLGRLFSIRFGNELDDRLKFAAPEQIRHQTLMRLRDFFVRVAQASLPVELPKKQPLLLILEDLHWADDLSLDLISLLMDALATTPLMMLCVYRPERDHRVWQLSDQARRKCLDRYTEIMLNPLSSRQSRQLVESLLEIESLPESTKDMILTKSEGNPFFIEEVIRSLIERDLVYHEDGRWKASDEIADMDVPDTIQSVLLARVDRLQAEAKYVLQCASVIGRLFKYRLLEHLSEHERNLDQYLTEFEERELVYKERTVPELEYAFKHALTQEATYQGILERRRREFHHQVAVGIEWLYRERLEEYYEELAHHYSRSEEAEKAVEYLLKAGEKAKVIYANEAAISHFSKALEMLEGHGIERNDWKLEALRGLGEIYLGIGKVAEAVEAFQEAIALAKEMELPPRQLVRLYDWIADALWWQSRYDEVIRYGEMGLEVLGDDTECMEAALMNSRIAGGNADKGNREKWREYIHRNMAFIRKLEYSVELRPPYGHIVGCLAYDDRDSEAAWEWSKELETRAGGHHDLRAVATAWMHQADILESKGDHKSALSSYQKSLDMFERIGDDKHASGCHGIIARILLNSGDIEEAETHAQVYLSMTEQVGNPRDIAWAHDLSGNIAMYQRRWEEAISHYQKCLEIMQTIGNPSWIAWAHLQLGRAYLRKGDPHRAFQSFEEAADVAIALPQETDSMVEILSSTNLRKFSALPTLQILSQIENTLTEERQQERFASILNMFYEKMELRNPGFIVSALQSAVKSSDELVRVLRGAEMLYESVGRRDTFLQICQQLKNEYSEVLQEHGLTHLYLESRQPSADYSRLDDADTFDGDSLKPVWEWVDPEGDCTHELISPSGLQVTVPSGHDLCPGNPLNAPRLLQAISGDFAVETRISDGSQGKKLGGLFVWKDEGNFARFDVASSSVWYVGSVYYGANVDGKFIHPGVHLFKAEEVWLRLERNGDRFTGYVSADGENWYRCGWADIPMEDPIRVGIHALCPLSAKIPGILIRHSLATSTRFEYFKIFRAQ